jgi:hypothetical protein
MKMIPYDQIDQSNYYSDRSFYITTMLGLEPHLITADNYESIREIIFLQFDGPMKNRLITEAGNILFFATTVGYAQ